MSPAIRGFDCCNVVSVVSLVRLPPSVTALISSPHDRLVFIDPSMRQVEEGPDDRAVDLVSNPSIKYQAKHQVSNVKQYSTGTCMLLMLMHPTIKWIKSVSDQLSLVACSLITHQSVKPNIPKMMLKGWKLRYRERHKHNMLDSYMAHSCLFIKKSMSTSSIPSPSIQHKTTVHSW